jgi:hypothetical protein
MADRDAASHAFFSELRRSEFTPVLSFKQSALRQAFHHHFVESSDAKYALESTLPHDRESTAEKNQQIVQKAGLARIFEIELDFLKQQCFDIVVPQVLGWNMGQQFLFMAKVQGRPSRKPWSQRQDFPLVGRQFRPDFPQVGPWSHKAHSPGYNVEELGQLIHFRVTQRTPDPRNSRISPRGNRGATRAVGHGSKFQKLKLPAIPAYSILSEQNRPLRSEPYHYCNDQHQRKAEKECGHSTS